VTADPKTLLAAPLHRANVPNAELLAGEQLALLRGNHLLADDPPSRRKPAAREVRRDCPHHPGTETPGGLCPTCGYRTEG
jgi:hypothetical protein